MSDDVPMYPADGNWCLEGYGTGGKTWVIHLTRFPFRVGRLEGSDLRLSSSDISRRHAELFSLGSSLGIREAGSTNGTFVNRQRVVDECILQDGDVIHFGHQEFRVTRKQAEPVPASRPASPDDTQCLTGADLPKGLFGYIVDFEQMLQQRAVCPHYQPLFRMQDLGMYGYELLGRCAFHGLPRSPGQLFQIARGLNRDVELSTLFRHEGIARARVLGHRLEVYFNTLPKETEIEFLRRDMPLLKALAPDLPMVMEVHEGAVTNSRLMHDLRALLADLDIKLAYDDFGAGYARLQELMDVPPDVLKFDIALIRDIHRRSPQSQQVIRTLVRMATDLGIKTLAEGVETAEELEVCREIGFDFAQGFLLGRPAPEFVGPEPPRR